jgi:abortive infection bacteriophage resistance protein
VTTAVPYLTLEQRVEYLKSHNYVFTENVSDDVRAYLWRVNFHYFLGYARNFRRLVIDSRVQSDPSLDHVVRIIELDQRVAAHLFSGFQLLEWRLRSLLVEHHCALYPSLRVFLDAEHYVVDNLYGKPTHESVHDQIVRMREPYVLQRFDEYLRAKGTQAIPSIERAPLADQKAVLATLPIWSVVDGWSFGLLVRVILGARPTEAAQAVDSDRFLWKRIARDCGVANPIFHGQLEALIVLRNQVAHHGRIWMRPTTNSPKAPKVLGAKSRNCDRKSMYIAFLTLSSMLLGIPGGREFLDQLDDLINEDPTYALGIKAPLRD